MTIFGDYHRITILPLVLLPLTSPPLSPDKVQSFRALLPRSRSVARNTWHKTKSAQHRTHFGRFLQEKTRSMINLWVLVLLPIFEPESSGIIQVMCGKGVTSMLTICPKHHGNLPHQSHGIIDKHITVLVTHPISILLSSKIIIQLSYLTTVCTYKHL